MSESANTPTVVLVHGGFADASFWVPVIKDLQAHDLPVLAPPNPLRGLAHDAEYIASYVSQIDGRRRDLWLRDELTAQELQIAQLAAEGLSNREIGQKFFVSPRTVSTHLYRIYPKLGISARSQLAVALSETP